MSEDEAIDILQNCIADYVIGEYCDKCDDRLVCKDKNEDCYFQQAIDTILDLYKELQNENARLKYLLRESSKIIDEYTNETENDTKKIIEYRKKYLEKGDKNE